MLDIGVCKIRMAGRQLLVSTPSKEGEDINFESWSKSILDVSKGAGDRIGFCRTYWAPGRGHNYWNHWEYSDLVEAMLTWDCSDLVEEVGSDV